jgi:ferritin-like metal-binding protein YciE
MDNLAQGDRLLDELKQILSAKWQIHQALPSMGERATTEDLKSALEAHHGACEAHLHRLQMIFGDLDVIPESGPCEAVTTILKGLERLPQGKDFDTALIGSLRRLEDAEMSALEQARQLAQELGRDRVAQLLSKNLADDGLTRDRLASIAAEL